MSSVRDQDATSLLAVSPLEGVGVFAASSIAEGELVCVWGGVVYTAAEVELLGGGVRPLPYPPTRGR